MSKYFVEVHPKTLNSILSFITDEAFKNILTRDIKEVQRDIKNECYKSSIVMSGSIIEAILLYELGRTKYKQRIALNINNLSLDDMLKLCGQLDILDPGTLGLADQIRNYRNVIHPRKELRQKITPNESTALIGFQVLTQILRILKANFLLPKKKKKINSLELNLSQLFKKLLKRVPAESDKTIYLPILEKYGASMGSLIVEDSLKHSPEYAQKQK